MCARRGSCLFYGNSGGKVWGAAGSSAAPPGDGKVPPHGTDPTRLPHLIQPHPPRRLGPNGPDGPDGAGRRRRSSLCRLWGPWPPSACRHAVAAKTAPAPAPGTPGAQPVAKPLTPPPAAPSAAGARRPARDADPPAFGRLHPTAAGRHGHGPPRLQDFVLFFAIGRKPDGTIVQNTYAAAEPTRMAMTKLIPGLAGGVRRDGGGRTAPLLVSGGSGAQEPAAPAPRRRSSSTSSWCTSSAWPTPRRRSRAPIPLASQVGLGTWVLTVKEGKGGPKATRHGCGAAQFHGLERRRTGRSRRRPSRAGRRSFRSIAS